MKFFLVSASNPTVKEEVDIPDEIVVKLKKSKQQILRKPRASKNLKKKKAISCICLMEILLAIKFTLPFKLFSDDKQFAT